MWFHVSDVVPAGPVCVLVASSVIDADAQRVPDSDAARRSIAKRAFRLIRFGQYDMTVTCLTAREISMKKPADFIHSPHRLSSVVRAIILNIDSNLR